MTPEGPDLVQRVAEFFDVIPQKLGVAVSGGGDSVALLCVLADWRATGGPPLEAVTVDHGLRPASVQEAQGVAELCQRLEVPHTTLHWEGWDGTGNLPDQARRARYRLIGDWAAGRGIPAVALGHTADDVAETFLMRLARGSGLDGLASMSDSVSSADGQTRFVRPVLHCSRLELREELTRRGQVWVDDPSNEDPQFERVRMRKAIAVLDGLGISARHVADTAARLRHAREELSHYVGKAARQALRFDAGDVLIPLPEDHPEQGHGADGITERVETFRRILKAGIMWISGAEYPPRSDHLEQLMAATPDRRATTVSGCHAVFHKGYLRLTRECKAVSGLRVPAGDIWDGRWRLSGPDMQGAEIAALGEAGLRHCPDRKATGRPAVSLMSAPAVWRGDQLIAAPLAGLENGWSAELLRDQGYYFSYL